MYSADWSYPATLGAFYKTERGCDTKINALC
nr:MAG TPA: hypothetical protein [Caudoviricetes sp.]